MMTLPTTRLRSAEDLRHGLIEFSELSVTWQDRFAYVEYNAEKFGGHFPHVKRGSSRNANVDI